MRREDVAVACSTALEGGEGAASAGGTKLGPLERGRLVVPGGSAARGGGHSGVTVGHVGGATDDRGRDKPPRWVDTDNCVGGGRRPAKSTSRPVADRSGGVVHVAAGAGLDPSGGACGCKGFAVGGDGGQHVTAAGGDVSGYCRRRRTGSTTPVAAVWSASVFSPAEGAAPATLMLRLITLEAMGASGVVVVLAERRVPIANLFHCY